MNFQTIVLSVTLALAASSVASAQWLELTELRVEKEETELGGHCLVIDYELNEPNISSDQPAYVFVRYQRNSDGPWQLIPPEVLRGDGFDIVETPGKMHIRWWGFLETGMTQFDPSRFRVRAIQMIRIPAGGFVMKSMPGQGRGDAQSLVPSSALPQFYIARNETTVSMYVDYLNEKGNMGLGWNPRMSHPDRCGIESQEEGSFKVKPGRELFPVTYVSWYDAVAFLGWCGLRLPSEAEFEKAIRGGIYLDGDKIMKEKNPNPERRYPWGNQAPNADGIFRCNFEGSEDGYEYTAPVGSFSSFDSPHGVSDLVGNVAEWTIDWYTTTHHAGLDGFRLVRGGSWMDLPDAVDAITGATQFPNKESSIMGFRGVR
jgi:formylglycine-generating enzyme required for sulfatase activity